ncbi:hypothetical protein ACN27G_15145 [Plantactinospora sp. WMMB334]|uniref:hypothetical protein n=1 Tax=Plantactinospora sp. WMMB334 TaxID=3404119 RepID=UPI003B9261F0
MVTDAQVVGGRLPDWISISVLPGSVPREVVDEAVEVTGKAALRSDGKLSAARDGVLRDGVGVVR